MENKKNIIAFKKVLATILIFALIICSVGIIANATTDGQVYENISAVADSVSKKFKVLIGDKESQNFEVVTETNENGEISYKVSVNLPEGDATAEEIDEALTDIIEFNIEHSGSDDGDYVFSGEEHDIIISDSTEVFVPTTAAAE